MAVEVVKAPVSGTIGDVKVAVGQVVDAETLLAIQAVTKVVFHQKIA